MAAQMQGHGRREMWALESIASLTLVLATSQASALPQNCSVPHVRSIYVIGLERDHDATHRKCLVERSLYEAYDSTGSASPKEPF